MRSRLSIAFVLDTLLSLGYAAPNISPQAAATITSIAPIPTLWQPKNTPGTPVLKWNYIINGSVLPIDLTVDVYDVDLYDTPDPEIKALQAAGKKIICYFSAGSLETWRTDWNDPTLNFGLINGTDYGPGLALWANEYWFDTNSPRVRNLMAYRIGYAASRGCDGVDPDNIDAYDNKDANPMNLNTTTAIDYLTFLNNTARPYNLAIGLKNGLKLVENVSSWLDWEVNEQCAAPPDDDNPSTHGANECGQLTPFVDKGKPVFHVEYDEGVPGAVSAANIALFCDPATTKGFSNVLKRMALDENTQYCP